MADTTKGGSGDDARPIIVLFHRDLRLMDHPALVAACETGAPVICLYIRDEDAEGRFALGGASKWWLHHALAAHADALEAAGNRLILRSGAIVGVLQDIVASHGCGGIYLSRGYEPWVVAREQAIHAAFTEADVAVKRFAGRLLIDPDTIRTKGGAVYKVYTPFWRAIFERGVRAPIDAPATIRASEKHPDSEDLDSWDLLPTEPNWAEGFEPHWKPGADEGEARFLVFVDLGMAQYDTQRDRPDIDGTSRLSPHYHHGELSVAACYHAADAERSKGGKGATGAETFMKELVWREFSYHLLYHFPHLPTAPFKEQFAEFPWRSDADQLKAWQRGKTGYPIVDAGMRQLYEIGWLHNRVRMIVGSFLTKNLLLPWQDGEAWFWDCLVDADLASNSASWQWVSGSGADAAPYFRIFNPVTQSERYDPEGDYIRRFVPELANMPKKYIHAPWNAPQSVLDRAGVTLGDTYPLPIVDHKETRQRALDAYEKIKK
ncbi:MAG: deoxyribodipyrimidine photo-lyase [Pseudomonadota bacterium]